jgi:hypothetical protein
MMLEGIDSRGGNVVWDHYTLEVLINSMIGVEGDFYSLKLKSSVF